MRSSGLSHRLDFRARKRVPGPRVGGGRGRGAVPGGLPGKVVWEWLWLVVSWRHSWRLAPGARLAGGFFTCSVVPAGARSYLPVPSATGQFVALPGPAGMLAVRQADPVQLAARVDAEQVRDRIVAEVRSNPLALLELPRGLRPAELAGGFGLAAASPLETRVEDSFHLQLRVLLRDPQQLLLTAAAEPVVACAPSPQLRLSSRRRAGHGLQAVGDRGDGPTRRPSACQAGAASCAPRVLPHTRQRCSTAAAPRGQMPRTPRRRTGA